MPFADLISVRLPDLTKAMLNVCSAMPALSATRGKIEATINNAARAIELVEEFGSIAAFVWRYEPKPEDRPKVVDKAALMQLSKTPESTALSKELKKRGWRFFGPTTAYAFMQSMGIVNDHLEGCSVRDEVEDLRRAFVRPI